jgi:4-amino-4-deoxychorismate lyase
MLVIQLHPKRDLESLRRNGVRIAVVSTRHLPASTLSPNIKSNNMLPYIAAKLEAKRLGVFEGILLSQEGYLAEGTVSNLFWVKKNIVYTPALSVGILPGVMRKHVIREFQKAGRKVVEGFFKPVVLQSADEVFITNSGIGKVRAKLK